MRGNRGMERVKKLKFGPLSIMYIVENRGYNNREYRLFSYVPVPGFPHTPATPPLNIPRLLLLARW